MRDGMRCALCQGGKTVGLVEADGDELQICPLVRREGAVGMSTYPMPVARRCCACCLPPYPASLGWRNIVSWPRPWLLLLRLLVARDTTDVGGRASRSGGGVLRG